MKKLSIFTRSVCLIMAFALLNQGAVAEAAPIIEPASMARFSEQAIVPGLLRWERRSFAVATALVAGGMMLSVIRPSPRPDSHSRPASSSSHPYSLIQVAGQAQPPTVSDPVRAMEKDLEGHLAFIERWLDEPFSAPLGIVNRIASLPRLDYLLTSAADQRLTMSLRLRAIDVAAQLLHKTDLHERFAAATAIRVACEKMAKAEPTSPVGKRAAELAPKMKAFERPAAANRSAKDLAQSIASGADWQKAMEGLGVRVREADTAEAAIELVRPLAFHKQALARLRLAFLNPKRQTLQRSAGILIGRLPINEQLPLIESLLDAYEKSAKQDVYTLEATDFSMALSEVADAPRGLLTLHQLLQRYARRVDQRPFVVELLVTTINGSDARDDVVVLAPLAEEVGRLLNRTILDANLSTEDVILILERGPRDVAVRWLKQARQRLEDEKEKRGLSEILEMRLRFVVEILESMGIRPAPPGSRIAQHQVPLSLLGLAFWLSPLSLLGVSGTLLFAGLRIGSSYVDRNRILEILESPAIRTALRKATREEPKTDFGMITSDTDGTVSVVPGQFDLDHPMAPLFEPSIESELKTRQRMAVVSWHYDSDLTFSFLTAASLFPPERPDEVSWTPAGVFLMSPQGHARLFTLKQDIVVTQATRHSLGQFWFDLYRAGLQKSGQWEAKIAELFDVVDLPDYLPPKKGETPGYLTAHLIPLAIPALPLLIGAWFPRAYQRAVVDNLIAFGLAALGLALIVAVIFLVAYGGPKARRFYERHFGSDKRPPPPAVNHSA